jgi:HK97 gp10 family phage protein
MGLKISGLNELRERLERLRPEEVMARALAEQAGRVAARVRDGLSEPPGATGHDEPWLQSGALRDSVEAQADGLQAVVGSSDPAAVPQEMGTAHMPGRPFLAPVAAEMGEEVARAVGAAMAAALRGDSPDANSTPNGGPDAPNSAADAGKSL